MKFTRTRTRLLFAAAFVAGTLQGSRLPETSVTEGATLAESTAHRAGSGADQEDAPPSRGGVIA